MVPGPNDPRLPPCDFDGHVEYFLATSAKVDDVASSFTTESTSPLPLTKMCLAVALMPSGGPWYDSFVNALENASNIPICREVVVDVDGADVALLWWFKDIFFSRRKVGVVVVVDDVAVG